MSSESGETDDVLMVIDVAEAFEAAEKTWIPSDYKILYTFFGANDLWHYIAVTDDRLCDACMVNDGMDMDGTVLRGKFEWLEIIDANNIRPNVHKNCRCELIRIHEPIVENDV